MCCGNNISRRKGSRKPATANQKAAAMAKMSVDSILNRTTTPKKRSGVVMKKFRKGRR